MAAELQPLPVHGYTAQPVGAVDLVNENKRIEERLLRRLDELRELGERGSGMPGLDHRWLAIARTHFEQGFMALNRAVFKPQRVTLPEYQQG